MCCGATDVRLEWVLVESIERLDVEWLLTDVRLGDPYGIEHGIAGFDVVWCHCVRLEWAILESALNWGMAGCDVL